MCGASPGSFSHRQPGAHDRPHLHLVDLGMQDPEAHAARAEHRVRLLELVDAVERLLELLHVAVALDARVLELGGELLGVGEELVQRRVEQADRDRSGPAIASNRPSKSSC